MNPLGGLNTATFEFRMFASRQIRYRFDFAAARRAITSAGLGSGKNGYFRVALIWARVGVRKNSEPRCTNFILL